MRNHQAELPLLTVMPAPVEITPEQLASFGTDEEQAIREAVMWAWRERRAKSLDAKQASVFCGITRQHFANIITGRKYLPPQKLNVFEDVVGNRAVSQTIARFRVLREEARRREISDALVEQLRRSA